MNEFVAKNGLISLFDLQAASLSGQPNTLLTVDVDGTIINSPYTIDDVTGGMVSVIEGISGILQEQITNNTENISYLGSISGDWARKSVANTFTQPNIFSSNVEIGGDLTVQGTTTTFNTETVLIEDNIITLNSNLTGGPPSFLNAGIKVNRGTGALSGAPYYFMWREVDQTFRIGTDTTAEPALSGVGDLTQAVATREDNPTPDRGIAVWNNTSRRFDTISASVAISGAINGTTNYLPKFTGTGTLGNSNITDSGTGITTLVPIIISGNSISNVPLTVQGYTGQTANLEEWQNSSGTVLTSINSTGGVTIVSLSGSAGSILTNDVNGLITDSALYPSINGAANSVPKTAELTTLDTSWIPTVEQWVTSIPTISSSGLKGQEYWDGTYYYKCIGTNAWIRFIAERAAF